MNSQSASSIPTSLPRQTGFAAALVITIVGVAYVLAIGWAIATGTFVSPPAEGLQLTGAVTSLIMCPALVVLVASLHAITPTDKKVLSQIGLGFTLLFALAVSINRFSQISVVRQAQLAGQTEGITWFLAYGDHSIFLGLEYLGWAWFLSLALLFCASLFTGSRLAVCIRWLMIAYGLLGLAGALGFTLGTWLSILGFVAWGPVLLVIGVLLVAYFRSIPNE